MHGSTGEEERALLPHKTLSDWMAWIEMGFDSSAHQQKAPRAFKMILACGAVECMVSP